MRFLWNVTVVRVAEWMGIPSWGVLVGLVALMVIYGIAWSRLTRE